MGILARNILSNSSLGRFFPNIQCKRDGNSEFLWKEVWLSQDSGGCAWISKGFPGKGRNSGVVTVVFCFHTKGNCCASRKSLCPGIIPAPAAAALGCPFPAPHTEDLLFLQACPDPSSPPAPGSGAVTKIKRREHPELITSSKGPRNVVQGRLLLLSGT